MSDRKPKGNQVDTINRYSPFTQMSFDLNKQDAFVTAYAVDFKHFKAMPSPIGKNDRGDYRRSAEGVGVDVISSNGMLYQCAGTFSATMSDNNRNQKDGQVALLDPSQSRIILPRFYNDKDVSDGERIYLAPGDRIYVADKDADTKVANWQEMDYIPGVDNVPVFPIAKMDGKIIDSLNKSYICGVDFKITQEGNISWLSTGSNPGVDPDTGKGRVYSLRYLYNAFWYVTSLPKEVRITNVTTDGVRSPERMPYYAVITREYVYHNQNRASEINPIQPSDIKREDDPLKPVGNRFVIPVDMSTVGEDDGQS